MYVSISADACSGRKYIFKDKLGQGEITGMSQEIWHLITMTFTDFPVRVTVGSEPMYRQFSVATLQTCMFDSVRKLDNLEET